MGFYEDFSKYYDLIFQAKKPQLDFHTRLTIEKSGEKKVFENHTPLFPIRYEALRDLLGKAGFKKIQAFSNFMEEDYDPEARPLIITGEKL